MTQTSLNPGILSRIARAARYVVGGNAPDAWFGPLQPLAPMAPPEVAGRRFDYPTGYNLNYTPRSYDPVSFDELRALADGCDILRSVIETRKDQVEAQEWTVRVKPSETSSHIPLATDDQKLRIDTVLAFLHSPDKEHGFDQWLRQILEDMFVIDGVALYKRRNRAGGLYALEVIDAGTIKLLLDDSGRLPLPPDPAYQQILKGIPAADYTREELMYLVHNPRSHRVYGYSHVEQILVTVNILIRRSMHQLEYYREGSTPDALVGLPKDWTMTQIADFQKHFDTVLAGNIGMRRRVRFMPGEFHYQETKAPPLKDAYDEFLARVVCFVFSISPEPFVGQVNRATAETSHARAVDEGLSPLMRFVRSFMNRIIAEEFASPDLEFVWQDAREQDPAQAAQIDVAYVGAGVLTVDEVRANMGLAPLANAKKPPATAVLKSAASSRKYNPNHLGPGPGGGQFTSSGHNGTSNGLPPGSGTPVRSDITPPSRASGAGVRVAGRMNEEIAEGLAAENQMRTQSETAINDAAVARELETPTDESLSVGGLIDAIGNATAGSPYVGPSGILVNAQNAVIDPNKITGYVLNPNNERGSDKAIVFNSALGYNHLNADGLIQQLQQGITQNTATLKGADQYGVRFTVDIPVTGPNGNTGTVRTGWIYDPKSATPRLVTAIVKK